MFACTRDFHDKKFVLIFFLSFFHTDSITSAKNQPKDTKNDGSQTSKPSSAPGATST